jgi:predicted nucleotidyltransferase
VIDFAAVLRLLSEAGVQFIIVGGAAATAHGSARLTQDLDVVYRRDAGNLRRLALALQAQEPYLRGVQPGLPFVLDEETLGHGLNFTLVSKLGDLDLLGEIAGGGGFDDLVEHSIKIQLFGIECYCLGLAKLIDVKRAAGRPKDLEALAELEELLSRATDSE